MPGEPRGGWTLETLKEYLTALIDANDQRYQDRFASSQTAVNAALSAAKEAVAKAETASDKRFEGVNEFRATLADQQRTLMPRSEAELRLNALEGKLTVLEKKAGEATAQRTGGKETWAYVVAGISLLIAIVTFLFSRASQ